MAKQVLLDAAARGLVAFANKERKRWATNCLRVSADRVEATNMKILAWAKPSLDSADDFPEVGTRGEGVDGGLLVLAEAVKRIERDVPKSTPKPVLTNVLVDKQDKYATLTATDLEHCTERKAWLPEASWPETDDMRKRRPAAAGVTVMLQAQNLRAIADYAGKHGMHGKETAIELFIPKKAETPIGFALKSETGTDIRGVVMPVIHAQ